MTLLEAVHAAIAAEDAFDPEQGGPAYELIDASVWECRKVLERRPNAVGQLVVAARMYVAWFDADEAADAASPSSLPVDWTGYDEALAACRAAVKGD